MKEKKDVQQGTLDPEGGIPTEWDPRETTAERASLR
jgi:hypothetical protein